jgi:C4-type Zn-finger protein
MLAKDLIKREQKEFHLCCNSCKMRWEIMNKNNEVLHWGNLEAMQILCNILNS